MDSLTSYLIVFGVGVVLISISGFDTRCPKCKKWWAKKSEGSKEIDRKGGYKTVTRTDIIQGREGENIGSIERQEQVHVTRVTYQNY